MNVVAADPPAWEAHGRLQVSGNGHYLQHADGTGFYWLGDTAWKLARLGPDDVDRYVYHRAGRGFNVTQVDVSGSLLLPARRGGGWA